jgi:hypothetical protein
MRVREALEQLDAIHDHLAKAEEYRGFRVPGVALAGAVGLVAAAAQPQFPAADEPIGFVVYWVAVAVVCALLGGGAAVHAYVLREDEFARRRTRRVGAQFLPCVAAGAVLTVGFVRAGPGFVPFLPGVWAVVFGLGMISARPYLPRGVGLVGLFYLVIGAMVVCRATVTPDLSGWTVGGVFGPGHLATAAVLWARDERTSDG